MIRSQSSAEPSFPCSFGIFQCEFDLDQFSRRVLSQDVLTSCIAPDRRLEINRLDVNQVLGNGHDTLRTALRLPGYP